MGNRKGSKDSGRCRRIEGIGPGIGEISANRRFGVLEWGGGISTMVRWIREQVGGVVGAGK